MSKFEDELAEVINRHSKENSSNTPDYILANFLLDCLESWNCAINARDKWYGFKIVPGNRSLKTKNPPQNIVETGQNIGQQPQ